MKVYGIIDSFDPKTRLLTLRHHGRLQEVMIERSLYLRHHMHLRPGYRLLVRLGKRKKGHPRYKIEAVYKILDGRRRFPVVFHHQQIIDQTKEILNQCETVCALDLEMSMHPYYQDKNFVQEIIQVGYVIHDKEGRFIKEYKTFVKPTLHPKLTPRTLKFLSLTQQDVDQGLSFEAFFHQLEADVVAYQPAILVWGKNDQTVMQSHLKRIQHTPEQPLRFINLLQLHKNVFMYKDDLGLAKAYALYGHNLPHDQLHDALEDAKMTQAVFFSFKAVLNEQRPSPHPTF
jgi:sporulation inhibitor KapD